jgi:hypothetical protein
MLKISIVDSPRQRRMVVEGALVPPWTQEFSNAYENARASLEGRQLVIDVKGLTAISTEGRNLLLELQRARIKLRCGVYVTEVLRRGARESADHPHEEAGEEDGETGAGEG